MATSRNLKSKQKILTLAFVAILGNAIGQKIGVTSLVVSVMFLLLTYIKK